MATITISDLSFNSESYITELTKNDLGNISGGCDGFWNCVEGGFQRATDGVNAYLNGTYQESDYWYDTAHAAAGLADRLIPG